MPRLKPLEGYVTSKEATEMLDISDSTLSQYVKRGWLKRYGPPERKHKFYKLSEVEAILAARNIFDEYQEVLSASFEEAMLEDIPVIADIDEKTLNVKHGQNEKEPRGAYLPWIANIYTNWMQRNPQAFGVLRNTEGRVVAFSIFLPMPKEVIDQLVRGEISIDNISPDKVNLFERGKPLHIYVVALCVDPVFKKQAKAKYGEFLILGLMRFILDLGRSGIELETITARSYTADGRRVLRRVGMTHLRSTVPGIDLFSIRVAESGFWALMKYSNLLVEWKQTH